jgi:hypothetical protein
VTDARIFLSSSTRAILAIDSFASLFSLGLSIRPRPSKQSLP